MSGKLVGMVFDHYPDDVSSGELLLAVKLADNAHEDGKHIFPSVSTLARQTRQSERTVQYTLRRMVEMGWLILVKEGYGGGRGGGCGRPREYRISTQWIRAHDARIPESERPQWSPRPRSPGAESQSPVAQKQVQSPASEKEMGANSAPISEGKGVQSGAEMGATAVAEMGAIAVAPYPPLTVIGTNPPTPHPGGERPKAETGAPPPAAAMAGVPLSAGEADAAFDVLWLAYPRKVDQERARRAWHALSPTAALVQAVMAGVERWAKTDQWRESGGRFVPLLRGWLRHSRWLDVPGFSAPEVAQAEDPPPRQGLDMTPEQLQRNADNARKHLAKLRESMRGASCG